MPTLLVLWRKRRRGCCLCSVFFFGCSPILLFVVFIKLFLPSSCLTLANAFRITTPCVSCLSTNSHIRFAPTNSLRAGLLKADVHLRASHKQGANRLSRAHGYCCSRRSSLSPPSLHPSLLHLFAIPPYPPPPTYGDSPTFHTSFSSSGQSNGKSHDNTYGNSYGDSSNPPPPAPPPVQYQGRNFRNSYTSSPYSFNARDSTNRGASSSGFSQRLAEKSVNSVTLLGRVGMDPDIRLIPSGERVANLSLATSESWRDRATGLLRMRTDWHRISIYDNVLVDLAERVIRKGCRLYVSGYLHTRRWVTPDGQERFATEVVVPKVRGDLAILDNPDQRRSGQPFLSAPQAAWGQSSAHPSESVDAAQTSADATTSYYNSERPAAAGLAYRTGYVGGADWSRTAAFRDSTGDLLTDNHHVGADTNSDSTLDATNEAAPSNLAPLDDRSATDHEAEAQHPAIFSPPGDDGFASLSETEIS